MGNAAFDADPVGPAELGHRRGQPHLEHRLAFQQEGFIDLSNVMLVDPGTHKPDRTRTELRDGQKVRVFRSSGELVPEPTSA